MWCSSLFCHLNLLCQASGNRGDGSSEVKAKCGLRRVIQTTGRRTETIRRTTQRNARLKRFHTSLRDFRDGACHSHRCEVRAFGWMVQSAECEFLDFKTHGVTTSRLPCNLYTILADLILVSIVPEAAVAVSRFLRPVCSARINT